MNKIGILAGTFDPIHTGHIDFIQRVIDEKSLIKVYLLVEKIPRHKPVFASFEHRLNMVEIAVTSLKKIEIYDCESDSYPIGSCLPEIKKLHRLSQIYLLIGRDVSEHIRSWENSTELLNGVELIVADRDDGITSGNIRDWLIKNQNPKGLDRKVQDYIKRNNLYGSETISGA